MKTHAERQNYKAALELAFHAKESGPTMDPEAFVRKYFPRKAVIASAKVAFSPHVWTVLVSQPDNTITPWMVSTYNGAEECQGFYSSYFFRGCEGMSDALAAFSRIVGETLPRNLN